MIHPLAVANYFIIQALSDGAELNHLKLQKLVILAHAHHLANFNKPLISEGVMAWDHGPVVTSIYDRFYEYGGAQIRSMVHLTVDGETTLHKITDEGVAAYLDNVWRSFSKLTELQLSHELNHDGSPWSEIKKQMGDRGGIKLIPNSLLMSHYKIINNIQEESMKTLPEETVRALQDFVDNLSDEVINDLKEAGPEKVHDIHAEVGGNHYRIQVWYASGVKKLAAVVFKTEDDRFKSTNYIHLDTSAWVFPALDSSHKRPKP